MPAPTGSAQFVNTIGMVRVACCIGATVMLPTVMITSGASATSSAAYLTDAVGLAAGKTIIDLQVSSDCPAHLLKALRKYRAAYLCLRIARNERH